MQYEFEVLSIKNVNFTDDRGKAVSGQQLWVIGKTGEASWLDGYEVVKLWIPDGHPMAGITATLLRCDPVLVTFDRRGKPMQIEVIR